MSGLETAIRNALDKSDRSNAEIRARIYQSSRQALEAGLRKQGVDDPQQVSQQRQRLEMLIHQIENEERTQLRDAAMAAKARAEAAAPDIRMQPEHADTGRAVPIEPELRAGNVSPLHSDDHRADFHAERSSNYTQSERPTQNTAQAGGSLEFRPETALRVQRRRRGFFSRLFIMTTLFAFMGIGAWWVYSSGLLLTAAQRDTSVPNPPVQIESEDFHGAESEATGPVTAFDPARGFSDDWVEIYRAEQGASGIKAGGQASVEAVATSAGVASRVTSRNGGDGGNVSIAVPVALLQQMAGKSSTVAVTLQSSTDRQTQISVSCDFASLGDCSRHRFTATPEKADMLFKATFERSLVPNSPGALLINSDIDGNGRPINIYSVRILPGQ